MCGKISIKVKKNMTNFGEEETKSFMSLVHKKLLQINKKNAVILMCMGMQFTRKESQNGNINTQR